MHRLLIADSNEIFLYTAKRTLEADFEIQTCQDGETALELLSSFQPTALILGLSLPFKDGLTVLRETPYCPPVIIATTVNTSPYVENTCYELGVGYLMISPCMNALQVQLVCMVNDYQKSQSKPDLWAQTKMHLHIMSVPNHRIGYKQLLDAIPLYCKDPTQCLELVLYAEVARLHNGSVQSVEKAMREAIKQAWLQRDKLVWSKYFPNQKECPSNKKFFEAMANFIKE